MSNVDSSANARLLMNQVDKALEQLGDLLSASKSRAEADAIFNIIDGNAYVDAGGLWDDSNAGENWPDDEQDKEGQNEAPE